MATQITSITWDSFGYALSAYSTSDANAIAANIVALQRTSGGWGKGVDPAYIYSGPELAALVATEASYYTTYDVNNVTVHSHHATTFDEGLTGSHVRYLLRAGQQNANVSYQNAAITGLNFILSAQYPSGGIPQHYPNIAQYGGYVTFNDGAMVSALNALKDAASGTYTFISAPLQAQCLAAFNLGVQFILNSQIVVNGRRTGWCAQHDPVTYAPTHGRCYELPAIWTPESHGVIEILQGITSKSYEVMVALLAALKFFNSVAIYGYLFEDTYSDEYSGTQAVYGHENPDIAKYSFNVALHGFDRQIVSQENAAAIWARCYDIETFKPFFCGWDEVKRFNYSGMDLERRTGYLWLSNWLVNTRAYMPVVQNLNLFVGI